MVWSEQSPRPTNARLRIRPLPSRSNVDCGIYITASILRAAQAGLASASIDAPERRRQRRSRRCRTHHAHPCARPGGRGRRAAHHPSTAIHTSKSTYTDAIQTRSACHHDRGLACGRTAAHRDRRSWPFGRALSRSEKPQHSIVAAPPHHPDLDIPHSQKRKCGGMRTHTKNSTVNPLSDEQP